MRTITVFLSMFAISTALAQTYYEVHPTTPTNQHMEIVVGDTLKHSSTDVYNTLIENAPAAPSSSDLPKFSIIGKERKFYLSIGAKFKSTINFDWGNPLASPSAFAPSNITQASPGNSSNLDFTIQRSRVSFNFVGLPDTEHQLGLYIAMEFNGSSDTYDVKINHAYVKYHGITAGYTSTLFSDQTAIPFTIDAQSPNSTANFSNTVIDYEHQFNNGIKMGIGLEKPIYSYTTNSYTSVQNSIIPDIPLYLHYRWAENSHIRASVILRNMQYRNLIANKNNHVFGWGTMLSGTFDLNKITFYYMGKYGKGMASYIEDNLGKNLDLVPSNTKGNLTASKSWGAMGAVQYDFSDKLFCTGIYSHIRNYIKQYNEGSITFGEQYRFGQYVTANLIWSPNKFIQTGIEYIWGRRVNFDNTQHHNNRIMAMFSVSL